MIVQPGGQKHLPLLEKLGNKTISKTKKVFRFSKNNVAWNHTKWLTFMDQVRTSL